MITILNPFQTYNDGKWHTVELAMSKNYAVLAIDSEKAETKRILDISTGPYYMIGGGIYGQKGFIGSAFIVKFLFLNREPHSPSGIRSHDT
jgi:hypothetical protein